MRVDIQGSDISEVPTLRRHIEQRALFELARYGERIDVVRIRISERPSMSDWRYHCGIAVTVMHADGSSGQVLARGQDNNVHRVVESVLERAGRLAGGEIVRGQETELARA